jgi:hypothetical protein
MNTIDANTAYVVHLIGISTVAALCMSFATIVWMGDYLMQMTQALATG